MKELQRRFKLLFNRFKERMIKIGVDTLIFDEFEKIHTETEFTGDIADVLSEFIMWFPERNCLGIPYPDDMYNYAVLKKGAVNTRAKVSVQRCGLRDNR